MNETPTKAKLRYNVIESVPCPKCGNNMDVGPHGTAWCQYGCDTQYALKIGEIEVTLKEL